MHRAGYVAVGIGGNCREVRLLVWASGVNKFFVLEGCFHCGKPFGVAGVIGEFSSAATSHGFEVCFDWKSVGQLVGVVDVDAFWRAFWYYSVDDDFVGVDFHIFGGSL